MQVISLYLLDEHTELGLMDLDIINKCVMFVLIYIIEYS